MKHPKSVTGSPHPTAGPVSMQFAMLDHPWLDSANGAAVRIAMTDGIRSSDAPFYGGNPEAPFYRGKLHGAGFIVTPEDAASLGWGHLPGLHATSGNTAMVAT